MTDGGLAILVFGGLCLAFIGVAWQVVNHLIRGLFYSAFRKDNRPTYHGTIASDPPRYRAREDCEPQLPPPAVQYHLPPARIRQRTTWVDIEPGGRGHVQQEVLTEWSAPRQLEYEDAEWREAASQPHLPRHYPKMLPRPE